MILHEPGPPLEAAPRPSPRLFVSHASGDRTFVDSLVELFRTHYLDVWYSPRHIPAGFWEGSIRRGLAECDWLVVVLSPAALQSEWVRREVELALADPRYYDREADRCRIVPVLIQACNWQDAFPGLKPCQLFDFTGDPDEARDRILSTWGVRRHVVPPYRVGNVTAPVHVFVGGDGHTRYGPGDVHGGIPDGHYRLPDDVRELGYGPGGLIAAREAETRTNDQVFENLPQVRLGGARPGLRNKPLTLRLGWTEYFNTFLTNMNVDARLPDGMTIGQKYAGPIDDLSGSQLSNPVATNLSVVTTDGFIYVAQRGRANQWNTGELQPAVSGDGQPEDLRDDGTYDPFHTARREAEEEALGFMPPVEAVTFFGLAVTFKARFPFLFGEIRVPLDSGQLESRSPSRAWEGRLRGMGIPFTVEGVCDWVLRGYRDQRNRRLRLAAGTTLFSVLQSLHYEYPNRWPEVIDRLMEPRQPPPL
jgi:hypothetical protein